MNKTWAVIGVLDLSALADGVGRAVQEKWRRRDWSQFDYLTVEPPAWCLVMTFFLTLAASAGCAYFAIHNEHE